MARQPRIFLPGVSVHVIHRGNNRMEIFHDEADRLMMLSLMQRATRQYGVDVHGYVLMTTHTHMLVTPRSENSLASATRQFAGRYAQYYNEKYDRIGTLWNGRYGAILVDDERYWLTCLRYIEQNPVRAGIARGVGDYPWSSYAAHALGRADEWLAGHIVYDSLGRTEAMRRAAYRAICDVSVTPDEVVPVHRTTRKGGVRHPSDPTGATAGSDGCLTPPLVQCADRG